MVCVRNLCIAALVSVSLVSARSDERRIRDAPVTTTLVKPWVFKRVPIDHAVYPRQDTSVPDEPAPTDVAEPTDLSDDPVPSDAPEPTDVVDDPSPTDGGDPSPTDGGDPSPTDVISDPSPTDAEDPPPTDSADPSPTDVEDPTGTGVEQEPSETGGEDPSPTEGSLPPPPPASETTQLDDPSPTSVEEQSPTDVEEPSSTDAEETSPTDVEEPSPTANEDPIATQDATFSTAAGAETQSETEGPSPTDAEVSSPPDTEVSSAANTDAPSSADAPASTDAAASTDAQLSSAADEQEPTATETDNDKPEETTQSDGDSPSKTDSNDEPSATSDDNNEPTSSDDSSNDDKDSSTVGGDNGSKTSSSSGSSETGGSGGGNSGSGSGHADTGIVSVDPEDGAESRARTPPDITTPDQHTAEFQANLPDTAITGVDAQEVVVMEAVMFDYFVGNDPAPADAGNIKLSSNVSNCKVEVQKRSLNGVFSRDLRSNCNYVKSLDFDVYFNYIRNTTDSERPNNLGERVETSVTRLNDAFGPLGITFNYKSYQQWAPPDSGSNKDWSKVKQSEDRLQQWQTQSHTGDMMTVNVWLVNDLRGSDKKELNGYASFPWDKKGTLDGIVMREDRINKDDVPSFIHEIGHWLGLRHTFREPVDNTVDDCKAADGLIESSVTSGLQDKMFSCSQTTCDSSKARDIINYMSFSPCRGKTPEDGFTTDQKSAIYSRVLKYRRGYREGECTAQSIDSGEAKKIKKRSTMQDLVDGLCPNVGAHFPPTSNFLSC